LRLVHPAVPPRHPLENQRKRKLKSRDRQSSRKKLPGKTGLRRRSAGCLKTYNLRKTHLKEYRLLCILGEHFTATGDDSELACRADGHLVDKGVASVSLSTGERQHAD
jgi:hypothetical protein